MKLKLIFLLLFFIGLKVSAQQKSIHVFVALCDNENQGIIPVPKSLGNGQDAKSNLYWGAMYGIKSFFRYKSENWEYIKSYGRLNSVVIERIVFKHKREDIYLIADAYDGAFIKKCTEDFLLASNAQGKQTIELEGKSIGIGGNADLLAYIGHDGLMEFEVDLNYVSTSSNPKETIILACISRDYFSEEIKAAGATPLLWTTGLMAPEAYSLEAALEGWVNAESNLEVKERAAQAYHKYQKCDIKGARGLFSCKF